VAWLLEQGRSALVVAAILLDLAIAVIAFGAHDAAPLFGRTLPARYDPLHWLRGWRTLGQATSALLARHPGTLLMSDDREVMAALIYYVEPHPLDALKWNGDCASDGSHGIHDQFDLTAHPERYLGANFMLVAKSPDNVERILSRFEHVDPLQQDVYIPLDRKTGRRYKIYWLQGFKGYRSCEATGAAAG